MPYFRVQVCGQGFQVLRDQEQQNLGFVSFRVLAASSVSEARVEALKEVEGLPQFESLIQMQPPDAHWNVSVRDIEALGFIDGIRGHSTGLVFFDDRED